MLAREGASERRGTKRQRGSRFLGDISNMPYELPNLKNDVLYRKWVSMFTRCYTNAKRRSNYKKLGIKVDERWHGIEGFYRFKEWSLQNGFSEDLVIDRINGYGDYSPDNCRWVTKSENNKNRIDSVTVDLNGARVRVADLAREYGISYSTLYKRLKNGWDLGKALAEPVASPAERRWGHRELLDRKGG